MKSKYIVGNWKMNQTLEQVESFFSRAHQLMEKKPHNCNAWIAPQTLHLARVLECVRPHSRFEVGGQNVHSHDYGAYTGESSPASLKELGATFCLIGHSERRTLFAEDDEFLRSKVLKALESKLKVIFCVGENREERESCATAQIITRQLQLGLGQLPPCAGQLLIAYEPVWAIGTGQSATPEQAQEAHRDIYSELPQLGLNPESTPLLYGGSVKPSNIVELLSREHIDGALIGGASLDAESFVQLCQLASDCSPC